MNVVHLIDCMEFMKGIPDKHYELAIVDPPYGIGFGEFNRTNKDANGNRFKSNKYKNGEWDISIPDDKYFEELIRISKNQIVWGGNYFPYLWQKGCKGFIFWYKQNPVNNFSDGELAYTSFDKVAKCFNYQYYGNINSEKDRIHPTQKPVALYKWLLKNYAKPNDKIFDSHVGSGSIRIACHDMGFDFEGCEIDKDYWEAQEERYLEHIAQPTLFEPVEMFAPTQGELL
jgi:site-specific DNA-methyltransferase (adenine-specific)